MRYDLTDLEWSWLPRRLQYLSIAPAAMIAAVAISSSVWIVTDQLALVVVDRSNYVYWMLQLLSCFLPEMEVIIDDGQG
jgi:hypothetical protein